MIATCPFINPYIDRCMHFGDVYRWACTGAVATIVTVESAWATDESTVVGDETPTVLLPNELAFAGDEPGAIIDRYVVIESVGQGGMGTVLRAYDPRLHREVALKRIRVESMGAGAEARLEREAQAMARLSHPNVVSVYDVHASRDGVFIAMEYVPGRDMKRWWTESSPTWREILEAMRQAGAGIARPRSPA